MRHLVVCHDRRLFCGWPANIGLWSWGDEIAVGFTSAPYLESRDSHSFDRSGPRVARIARSRDAGESWTVEAPTGFPQGYSFGDEEEALAVPARPLDFEAPDLALRCAGPGWFVSRDRCRTWNGPFAFSGLSGAGALTSRTDAIVLGPSECLFLLSERCSEVRATLPDRAFCARTGDGGLSFERLGLVLPERPEARSVMPSTVHLADGRLVAALRRRIDSPARGFWIEAAESADRGRSWRSLGRVADTDDPRNPHNGNPAALLALADGRLCAVYGCRAVPAGIRARLSADGGRAWGPEILLRGDGRTWDLGYPRAALRPDGRVLVVYYFTTAAAPEQHIAATIWDPRET